MTRTKDQTARWNLKVSREADAAVRTYLSSQRAKRGGLSKFVEEAACWRVSLLTRRTTERGAAAKQTAQEAPVAASAAARFRRTVEDIKRRNAGIDPGKLQELVDEALGEVRLERRPKKRAR